MRFTTRVLSLAGVAAACAAPAAAQPNVAAAVPPARVIGAKLEARTAVKDAFRRLTLPDSTQAEDWPPGGDLHGLLAV